MNMKDLPWFLRLLDQKYLASTFIKADVDSTKYMHLFWLWDEDFPNNKLQPVNEIFKYNH